MSAPPSVVFQMPPEPWFYQLLSAWGQFAFWLGVLAAAGGACAAIVAASSLYGNADREDFNQMMAWSGLATWVVTVGFVVLTWLTSAAVILIGVDVARNVRRTRCVTDFQAGLPVRP